MSEASVLSCSQGKSDYMQTTKEPEVAHELSGLNSATEELNEMINYLEIKLVAVMGETNETASYIDEDPKLSALCELAEMIRTQKARTLSMSDRIRRITGRLEI